MDDRELLGLAAEAIGGEFDHGAECITMDGIEFKQWNPLEDDGDALRLAVKLGLLIDLMSIDGSAVTKPCVSVEDSEGLWEVELCDSDPYAATRRAIASAAAEIGKEKP